MSRIFDLEAYLPDRPPGWSDVAVVVSGLLLLGLSLQSSQPSSLSVVALGFGSAAILFGPVAQTRVGKRIDRWGTEIGPAGRAAVITLFAIAFTVAFSFDATPTALIRDIGLGFYIFGILAVAVHLLHEGRIEGWFPERS